jgi:hypothetical protein
MHYKEAGIHTDSFGNIVDIKYPTLRKMKEDILSASAIEDVDVKNIWDAIYIGEPLICMSRRYDAVLSFRAKGSSPHNRVKFAFSRTVGKKFFYKFIKKVVVDEDKWHE